MVLEITRLKAQNLTSFSCRWMRAIHNLHLHCILPLTENKNNLQIQEELQKLYIIQVCISKTSRWFFDSQNKKEFRKELYSALSLISEKSQEKAAPPALLAPPRSLELSVHFSIMLNTGNQEDTSDTTIALIKVGYSETIHWNKFFFSSETNYASINSQHSQHRLSHHFEYIRTL